MTTIREADRQYAANTTYQLMTLDGYTFLIHRLAWQNFDRSVSYTYDAYEPFVCSPDWHARHSTMYHALGETWGNIESWFNEDQFAHLKSWTGERYDNVRIYHQFRKAIAEYLIQEAISRDSWQRLPFID